MSLFGVEVPQSSEILVKIRFITGRGQPFIAWQGSSDANEAEVLEDLCKSPLVCSYIKRAVNNRRLRADENGAYKIAAKIICYESGQVILESPTEITIYPAQEEEQKPATNNDQTVVLDVVRTLVDSVVHREQQVEVMLEHVNRLHTSYERAILAISQHSLQSMDKVSNHAASAFSAAAAPFAEVSKSLVKSLDDSRSHSATNAKEAQDLLIEALKNRIIENNQISKQSVTQDIKEVLQLWPMLKGLLSEAEPKPPT